ncbi:MAG: mechanosensitive ion channel family protein [Vicinamibacterales bacterium]
MTIELERILTALVVLLFIAGGLLLVMRCIRRAVRRSATRLELQGYREEAELWAKRIISLTRHAVQALVVLVAAVVMVEIVGVPGVARVTWTSVLAWLTGPGLRIVLVAGSAYILVRAVQFLVESLQILLVSRAAPGEDLDERKKRIATMGSMLALVATVLIAGIAIVTILALVNVDIRPILTGAGIAGLAVGFGAQNLVRDVISGFFLILEDQVRVGDVVDINGKTGGVEEIRLRTITLRALDGTVHIIPNGAITQISNMTKDYSYAVIDANVSYNEDVDRVAGVLERMGAEVARDPALAPYILGPLEVLGLDQLAPSAVIVKARMKTAASHQWAVARELRRRMKLAFEAEGIEMPLQQMSVHLKRRHGGPGRVSEKGP